LSLFVAGRYIPAISLRHLHPIHIPYIISIQRSIITCTDINQSSVLLHRISITQLEQPRRFPQPRLLLAEAALFRRRIHRALVSARPAKTI
jgi:hypothetical protein